MRSEPPRGERVRHSRKYAEGSVGPERSFTFSGPEGKLSLKAQNLVVFLQMADGVDEKTWMFHLRQKDYSRWFRDAIKDNDLAEEAEKIENGKDADAAKTKAAIREAVENAIRSPRISRRGREHAAITTKGCFMSTKIDWIYHRRS